MYQEQFQNKYDLALYIALFEDELKKKFEFVFLEREQPYEKLFGLNLRGGSSKSEPPSPLINAKGTGSCAFLFSGIS